jgi:CheY-like chemotaxis protein
MNTKKILIVDDVNFNIEFESKLIKNLMEEYKIKIQIDEAHSVEEAVKKIAAEAQPYDAIIIDTGKSTIDEVVLQVMNAVKSAY